MIQAAHNRFFDQVFGAYLNAHMHFVFKSITITNNFRDTGGPVLLIGNHFSWWDGFIARHVNKKVLHRKLHLMMQEDQLSKRKFLSKLGAFSIRRNSRDAINSLQYATNILHDPGNLLIIFPQGKFQSLHQHPLSFEKGWFRIIQKAPDNTQILFLAALTDYFASPRPHLNIYLDQPVCAAEKKATDYGSDSERKCIMERFSDVSSVESAYNKFIGRCIAAQNSKV